MICGKINIKNNNIFLEIVQVEVRIIFQLLKKYYSKINSILICDFTHFMFDML